MNKYVKFGTGLFLVQQEIKSKKVTSKRVKEKTNHIWIYDRSYSMSNELPEMINQLVKLSKNLPKGDTLTLGYFSSEGQYRFIVIGFKITNKSDYKFLEKTIRKNAEPLGCTCFSEIINETETIIKDLSEFSKNFSFSLFTDGYQVVSNRQREIDNIFSGIEKIKGKLTTSVLIGYGYYYNKELMLKMATKLSGMLIHNDNIEDYTNTITRLVSLSETLEPRIEVKTLVENPISVYTVTDQGVVLNNIEDSKLYISPESGKSTNLYYIVDDVDGLVGTEVTPEEFGVEGIYGGTLVLCQQMKTDKAMELVGTIGDKYFIDKLTNAFVIDEYGKVENELNDAIHNPDDRFITGKDINYLPKPDAFCVFDLLNILFDDDESVFYPYDSRFKYDKISKGTVNEDGYSKFTESKDNACGFNELVWHKSRLNLSVLTTVKGTIELQEREGKKAEDFGYIQKYPTWQYKNYSFIKDGRPNMKQFYVSTSKETYDRLKAENIVFDDTFKKNGIYGVDISNIPVINRLVVEDNTSGTELCKNIYTELKCMAKLKVYKYYLKEEFPEDGDYIKSFSEEQQAFLMANGIDVKHGGLYQPKYKSGVVAEDYYMAKRFSISLKGVSSLPSVNKVLTKMSSGNKPTISESLLVSFITEYNDFKNDNESLLERKKYIEDEIIKTKLILKPIRQGIQKTKFALILGNKSIDEFTSRDQTTLYVDGIGTFNFKFDEEKIKI